MPTVELSFSALPAHVRTARLVAAAQARRTGVEEEALDEVRLAVGEACSWAVERHRVHCPRELVHLSLTDGGGSFGIAVTDSAGPDAGASPAGFDAFAAADRGGSEDLPSDVGLAVIGGLVDTFEVEQADSGVTLRMSWPLAAGPRG